MLTLVQYFKIRPGTLLHLRLQNMYTSLFLINFNVVGFNSSPWLTPCAFLNSVYINHCDFILDKEKP